jgi:hypothetical protein
MSVDEILLLREFGDLHCDRARIKEAWELVARTLRVPPGLLRPEDEVSKLNTGRTFLGLAYPDYDDLEEIVLAARPSGGDVLLTIKEVVLAIAESPTSPVGSANNTGT